MSTVPCKNPTACGVTSHIQGSRAAQTCVTASRGRRPGSVVPNPTSPTPTVSVVVPAEANGSVNWTRMSTVDSIQQWESEWGDEEVVTVEDFLSIAKEDAFTGNTEIAPHSVNISRLADGSTLATWSEAAVDLDTGADTGRVRTLSVAMDPSGEVNWQSVSVAPYEDAEWKSDQEHTTHLANRERGIRRTGLMGKYGLTMSDDYDTATVTLHATGESRIKDDHTLRAVIQEWTQQAGGGKVTLEKSWEYWQGEGHPTFTFSGDSDAVFDLLDAYDRGE